jgi:phospholipid transport system substrate-binding protein
MVSASMRDGVSPSPWSVSRFLVVALMACVTLTATGPMATAQAEGPAKFMQRVANELISASRTGSSAAIGKVVRNYADVYSIGLSALGTYAPRLPRASRGAYHTGLIRYISRYAANESPKYPVASAKMTGQSRGGKNVFYVDSRVTLSTGQTYDVRWVLYKRGGAYKVRDAEVIGLRVSSFLDKLFQNYISSNGGNPKALVTALNK